MVCDPSAGFLLGAVILDRPKKTGGSPRVGSSCPTPFHSEDKGSRLFLFQHCILVKKSIVLDFFPLQI